MGRSGDHGVRVRIVCLVLLICSFAFTVALAEGPDYDLPGRFALPWACGEGYRITWDPSGHWSQNKATGVAFDFSMHEGTPVSAPTTGTAYFLRDERPFETNFGNYVEIVDESGDWMVRLAHLRDQQSGERLVKVGEVIAASGASGVSSPHLHLELLVRDGAEWVRPDLTRLDRLLGLQMTHLVEGAIITNDECAPKLVMDGEVVPSQESVRLGEWASLLVPLRNDGLEAVTLDTLQVFLFSPQKAHYVAEAQGGWTLEAKAESSVSVSARLPLSGDWYIGRVAYQGADLAGGMPAKGRLSVGSPALRLVGISTSSALLSVGGDIELEAWVENGGEDDFPLADLYVEGERPDGMAWRAALAYASAVPAGSVRRFTLRCSTVPQVVGTWKILRIGYPDDGQVFYFKQVDQSFSVSGAELRIEQMEAFVSDTVLHIFLTLGNSGTDVGSPDAIEVWGWEADGQTGFAAVGRQVRPIEPGQSALIYLRAPLVGEQGALSIVEAGYWQSGWYYRMGLPELPTVGMRGVRLGPES